MSTTQAIEAQLMTLLFLVAFLLFVLDHLVPGGGTRLLAEVAKGLIEAAWACVTFPLTCARLLGVAWGDQGRTLTCTQGCGKRFPGVGVTTCSSCSYRSRRSVFSPCPACGLTRRHVRCPHCRTSVLRPAYWTQPAPPRHYR